MKISIFFFGSYQNFLLKTAGGLREEIEVKFWENESN
jgi:hypothetical protein